MSHPIDACQLREAWAMDTPKYIVSNDTEQWFHLATPEDGTVRMRGLAYIELTSGCFVTQYRKQAPIIYSPIGWLSVQRDESEGEG